MPTRTIFINLNPNGASTDDSGVINMMNVKRMSVKSCTFDGTATTKKHFIISNMPGNDIVGIFSGVANIQLPQNPIVFDYQQPVNFQGTYTFSIYDYAGALTAITGNIVLHLEFETL